MKNRFRKAGHIFRENKWIFTVVLLLDMFYFLFLWLLDSRKTKAVAAAIFLLTVGLFLLLFFRFLRKNKRKEAYLQELFAVPDFYTKELDLSVLSDCERAVIEYAGERMQEMEEQEKALLLSREEQKEYVETWVHEIKTPISLMTLVLDNREEEMSREVHQRIQYVNTRLQEYVDQILYFSRVNCEHKDYLFEETDLENCVEEVLFDYGYFLKEKEIHIVRHLGGQKVFTDRKGLEFMIRQAVTNAIKYMPEKQDEKGIEFSAEKEEDGICLQIKDNGVGVPASDLPFVFDKGFSGGNGTENKKSTGMGLYLLKEMAKSLNITCRVASEYGEGFCVELVFPVV